MAYHGAAYFLLDGEAVQTFGLGVVGYGLLRCGRRLEPGPSLMGALVVRVEQFELGTLEIGSPLKFNYFSQASSWVGSGPAAGGEGYWFVLNWV
ncbi:hypothetical protein ACFVFJ_43270 [Streptomyces sp. NPDC057717]|uniref:hypothetical protein n=1 Tax=Streptomyces sp. NPDC057717 TaxID=3346224 RepID=UPI00367CE4E2